MERKELDAIPWRKERNAKQPQEPRVMRVKQNLVTGAGFPAAFQGFAFCTYLYATRGIEFDKRTSLLGFIVVDVVLIKFIKFGDWADLC